MATTLEFSGDFYLGSCGLPLRTFKHLGSGFPAYARRGEGGNGERKRPDSFPPVDILA